MPSPTTIDELVDLVRRSKVVDDKRLTAYLDRLRAAGPLPQKPEQLAGVLVRDGVLTHFQAEQFLLGKWRRFTIGKYKVLERLGSGGMGSVYLCEHTLMRRRVAVKVLPTAKAEDPAALERFFREARAVAALDHPNIVRAYDIDQEDNLHFLVMEHVDGSNLQEIVKKTGPLDPLRAAHYMTQSALGLQHAFETAGLVHRDIKPGNILVDRNGIVKILDMGLARFFHDEEDNITKKFDENVLGTADYLAPEQALNSHDVDVRADIYSLGATFYFTLTGRTPFSEGTVAQKLIWHQTRQPKAIRSLRPEVPEALTAVIDRMMAKDANQRFQTPAKVAEALSPWTQTPIPPPPESEMPQLSPAAMAAGEASLPGGRPPATSTPSPAPRRGWQAPGQPSPAPGPGPKRPPPPQALAPPAPAATAPAPPAAPREAHKGAAAVPTLAAPPVAPPAPPRPAPPPLRPAAAPAPAAAAPPANGPLRPAPAAPPRPAPPPPLRPKTPPPLEEDSPSWDQLGDTVDPAARIDTAPSARRKSPPARQSDSELANRFKRRGVPAWWILAAVSAVALVGLAALLWWFFSQKQEQGPDAPRKAPLMVRKGGGDNAYPTLQKALYKAGAGDVIELHDDIEETDVAVTIKNLTIQAAEGKHIRWTCPAGARSDANLLIISSSGSSQVNGLRLKGVITLDGGDRLDTLVKLQGYCPGLTLEELTLKGYRRTAIAVASCWGEADKRVVMSRLTFQGNPNSTAPLSFNLLNPALPASADNRRNEHFSFQGCNFGGAKVKAREGTYIDLNLKPEEIGPP
jgi:tRNA A-37 threonylcarbamoyl transferase component Bud32